LFLFAFYVILSKKYTFKNQIWIFIGKLHKEI